MDVLNANQKKVQVDSSSAAYSGENEKTETETVLTSQTDTVSISTEAIDKLEEENMNTEYSQRSGENQGGNPKDPKDRNNN